MENGTETSFTVEYNGVRVHWEIEYENCEITPFGNLFAQNEASTLTGKTDARLHMIFTIEQID